MILSDLPDDLHFLVLSYVPEDSLLRHCRLVCHRWKEIVDSQALWKLKCQRAGIVNNIGHFPVRFEWKRVYLTKPFDRNLIKNPCGEHQYNYWKVHHGGNGWKIATCEPQAETPFSSYFGTSYSWCWKYQIVDLLKEGLWEELLDCYQPDICISDWYSGLHAEFGCVYGIHVCLLAEDKKTIIAKFEENIGEIHCGAFQKVSCVFRNYGNGVRYVRFCHRGKDTLFWAGHYGALTSNSTVIVTFNKSNDASAVKVIERVSSVSEVEHLKNKPDHGGYYNENFGQQPFPSWKFLKCSDDFEDYGDDGDYDDDSDSQSDYEADGEFYADY
ncbi:F-box only protein 2-like [Protopterus annectens]|uniref:F-box only protein 2-like n=1 Tax=Protopterus annectens TaxID=7888 RepID=UPI001CF9A381|nr:F-box only protein 2-like [Protopterus annectens]